MLTNPIKPTQLKNPAQALNTKIKIKYQQPKPADGKTTIYKMLLTAGTHYRMTRKALAQHIIIQIHKPNNPISAHYQTTHQLPEIKIVETTDTTTALQTLKKHVQQAINTGEHVIFYCATCQQHKTSTHFMPSGTLRYTPCRECVNQAHHNNKKRKQYQSNYYKTEQAKQKRKAYYQSDKYKTWKKEYDKKLKKLGRKTLKEANQQTTKDKP